MSLNQDICLQHMFSFFHSLQDAWLAGPFTVYNARNSTVKDRASSSSYLWNSILLVETSDINIKDASTSHWIRKYANV